MAAKNEEFLADRLFAITIPVANARQAVGRQNNGNRSNNQQFDRGGNGSNGLQGERGRYHQRENNFDGNRARLDEGRYSRGLQPAANNRSQNGHLQNNFNRRNMSNDRSIMSGSQESLPGSGRGRRGYSAVRYRQETAGGNTSWKQENRREDRNNTDGNRQQGGRVGARGDAENGQRSENGVTEGGRRRGAFKQMLGFRRLEDLASKEPEDILVTLANSQSGFGDLLAGDLRPDLMILVVKVLAKACMASFLEVKVTVLGNACNRCFVDQLTKHVGTIPTDESKKRKAILSEFLDDLFTFCHTALSLLPVNASDVFPQLFFTIEGALKGVERYQGISMQDKIKQFDELQTLCVKAKKESEKKVSKAGEIMQYQEPPNNYREINLYPNIQDIFPENDQAPFIRPNIVKGSYINVEHYLDVQFRLLREDFVKPLREGIQEYLSSKKEKAHKFGSVRFYPKVIFCGTKSVNNSVGMLVCFDPEKRMKNIKWEFCRRFMFGSLLCFSKDNFHSVIFGKVLERDLKDLKVGNIVIDICSGIELQMDSSEYKMVESEVYFEPYYHVMKALQNMTENSFPMSQYIVQVQPRSAPPAYLRARHPVYEVGGYRFPVLDEQLWPSSSQLKLDDSQYRAFKSALTKEFVVIQGPPGTGKTFLGLKVATVLLKNVDAWNHPHTPILVVCFTNHALDQFLEGLLDVTENLVRVGGQSKNERLQKFSLKERRQSSRRTRQLSSLMKDQQQKMSELMRKIKSIQKDLELVTGNEGVVSLATLKEVGGVHQNGDVFRENGLVSNEMLLTWLTTDKDEFGNVDRKGEQAMNAQYPPQETPLEENGDVVDGYDDDLELEDINVVDDEIDLGISPDSIVPRVTLAVSMSTLESEIDRLTKEVGSLDETVRNDAAVYNRRWGLEDQLAEKKLVMNYLKMRLLQPQPEARVVERLSARRDLMGLGVNERWVVYRHWVGQLQEVLIRESGRLGEQFRKENRNMTEIRMMDDLEVMKDVQVVGMTTTGAARLQPLLQALKPKIVIVEEAAEVMESHIVVSLTEDCQHLILIGDHQQLRPTTADYHLARKFYFDISLFERMLKNGMHCETLKVQHRMRPEIARLIVPTIYPELRNDETVHRYEKILGVDKSLFFITHNHHEDKVEDSSSRKNTHEGAFVIALCRYLLMQGYQPDQITVLTTYSGQMFYLRNERRKFEMLREVKMTVVDNFQGEENDIILLSLVRSNEEGKIGFLSIENRVCVALSRARKGLYIIGNMDHLTGSSELWRQIRASLVAQQSLGGALPLRCQVHQGQCSQVKAAGDFLRSVPEGGCMLPCRVLMPCGHKCQSVCHVQDREHAAKRCLQDCARSPPDCTFYHKCPKLCSEECGECCVIVVRQLPCGHAKDLMCHVDHRTYKCQVAVPSTLPHCGHAVDKPCHRNVATFPCPVPCENRLPCGHSCELSCHVLRDPDHLEYKCRKPCAKTYTGCTKDHKCEKRCHEVCGLCTVPVQKRLECGHVHKVPCSTDTATFECRRDCGKVLPCGHKCKRKCFEQCGGCQEKVKKQTAGCGHLQTCKCCEEPDPSRCRGPCVRRLPCGHACTGVCRDPCKEPVPSPVRPACGHPIQLPCHLVSRGLCPSAEELLQYCQQPCGMTLQCKHKCKGSCGQCLQGRIHMPCGEKCGRVLICGHSCEIPCAESCPPCKQKCTYRCKHSSCSRKCGEPCIPCTELCELGCAHGRCTKLCHEPCNVKPCTRPCKSLLGCGHPCIGYCGDPCPPLCRVCDQDEVTEVFFGDEDEEDARFVYLEDCKHTLLGEALDTWLQGREAEISMKGCPKCKTPITRTQRYADMVKAVYQDVVAVKAKVFGDLEVIEASREQLKERLRALEPSRFADNAVISGSQEYKELYGELCSRVEQVKQNRRNVLSHLDSQMLNVVVDVISELISGIIKLTAMDAAWQSKLRLQLDLLLKSLGKRQNSITTQEVEDINLELKRFSRLLQMCSLANTVRFKMAAHHPQVKKAYENVGGVIMAIAKFSDEADRNARDQLAALNKEVGLAVIVTNEERRSIVGALGMRQGHWYKCPNGHLYVIGECGRAMQVGRCNECGASIGGTNHSLLSSNRTASEMD
ncbi:NFX1-type zinc finger-containing protein 1-like isoform X1 [Bacillus rossius redtenbacheri]|uniref:NFX1-type zinc finger-containing protein 1-like isoform X1 n=1 Tax=Bacillus rossius redtenbacheri TaxID=93214 RepID=UPI002FDD8FD4